MATNNNIQENLKKYFYSGVGLAAHTAEAFQKSMKELSKKGKVSEADGKRIVKEALKKVEARRPEIEAKYNAAVHKFVTASTVEMSKLQKKIQQLEGQLKTKIGAPSRSSSAGKSTVAKKKTVKRKKVSRKASPKSAKNTETGTSSTTTGMTE